MTGSRRGRARLQGRAARAVAQGGFGTSAVDREVRQVLDPLLADLSVLDGAEARIGKRDSGSRGGDGDGGRQRDGAIAELSHRQPSHIGGRVVQAEGNGSGDTGAGNGEGHRRVAGCGELEHRAGRLDHLERDREQNSPQQLAVSTGEQPPLRPARPCREQLGELLLRTNHEVGMGRCAGIGRESREHAQNRPLLAHARVVEALELEAVIRRCHW